MKPLSKSFVSLTRQAVFSLLDRDASKLPGACLYHAVIVKKLTGMPIQAGSYSWRYTKYDDGKNPTHFSCIFDERAQRIATGILVNKDLIDFLGVLPEMHVWNSFGSGGEIMDLSTLHIPTLAQKISQITFEPELLPPDHLVAAPINPSGQWVYREHPVATRLANRLADVLLEAIVLRVG